MKTIVRIGLVLLLVAVIAGGSYWFIQQRSAAQTTDQSSGFTQIVAVQQGNLNASISVVGELYAPQNETMSFERVSGTTTLASLDVEPGSVVTAGQVLATIDPTPYQQALDQATSDLQSSQQTLSDLETAPTSLDIAQADLAIAQAEYALQQARDDLESLQDPDIAALKTAVSDAQLALVQAQSNLASAQPDQTSQDKLSALQDKEGDLYTEYSRLASETYSDTYYQDRLALANNAFLAAQDTRISTELQQQINLLKAHMQVTQAETKLANAQEALADGQAAVDALDLATADQAVAQAEADLADARDARAELDKGPDTVDLTAAQADVDKKQLAVSEAQADLDAATLVASFDGTVLDTSASTGDRITASSPILTLANLNELEVTALIDETTIRDVQTGQPASITFDAYPGQTFRGEVLAVPLQGTLQGGVMVYEVPISLEGADTLPLLVGMTANVAIQTGQAENALLVPTIALQNVGGLTQVLVPNSDPTGDPVSVPVEVGLSNGTYTQVTKGLNIGDQVVIELAASNSSNNFRGFGPGALDGGGPPPGVRPGD